MEGVFRCTELKDLYGATLHKTENNVGFEAITPVVMKSSIFWDITPLKQ
jgi:hypothetical protein